MQRSVNDFCSMSYLPTFFFISDRVVRRIIRCVFQVAVVKVVCAVRHGSIGDKGRSETMRWWSGKVFRDRFPSSHIFRCMLLERSMVMLLDVRGLRLSHVARMFWWEWWITPDLKRFGFYELGSSRCHWRGGEKTTELARSGNASQSDWSVSVGHAHALIPLQQFDSTWYPGVRTSTIFSNQ